VFKQAVPYGVRPGWSPGPLLPGSSRSQRHSQADVAVDAWNIEWKESLVLHRKKAIELFDNFLRSVVAVSGVERVRVH
jgi:hypothetical protein